MALMHIFSFGMLNQLIETHEAHEIMDFGLTYQKTDGIFRQTVTILRNADKLKLKHIMFETTDNVTLEQFKDLQKDSKIQLLVGESLITTFYLNLLMELNEIKQYGSTFVITIPHEYTVDELLLRSLNQHNSQLIVETNGQYVTDVRIFGQYIFVDQQEVINLEQNVHEKMFQDIRLCGNYRGVGQNVNVQLDDYGMTKGYFIEGNISNIRELLLQLNGHDRFERYNVAMLNTNGNRISDKLLYLPYNNDSSFRDGYKNMAINSYIGSLNSSRINTIMMKFRMETREHNIENSIKIYSVSFNFIAYEEGVGRLLYDLVNSTKTQLHIWQTILVEESDPFLNGICPISQNLIGDSYCLCTTCKNAFGFESLNTWLKKRQICPMCRSNWTNRIKYTKNIGTIANVNQTVEPIANQIVDPIVEPIVNQMADPLVEP
jgi:hypothetical protein